MCVCVWGAVYECVYGMYVCAMLLITPHPSDLETARLPPSLSPARVAKDLTQGVWLLLVWASAGGPPPRCTPTPSGLPCHQLGPWWLSGKESASKAGEVGSIPGQGRSPGEGNGYALQDSCLENPMDRGAWWAMTHGVTKSWT